jgi:tetratricopeptide (TPR) repeat protein
VPRQPSRSTPSAAATRARAEKALREGRAQQALDLAQQLQKAEPTPEHLELFQQAYLARARQLQALGASRDALRVLEVACNLDPTDPTWAERLAPELALCGATECLASLAARFGGPSAGRLLAHTADAAVRQGAAGREALPESLRPDFDRVALAFAHAEAGRDDAALESLAGIGLRSPFLEWKLLLRGLQAYYLRDDARALENWQRLAPVRIPARLAAPFRAALDRAFRTAQLAAAQARLQQHFDRLQGSPLAARLRGLRAALADKESLGPAFRQAEALLPELRREAPGLDGRLAACFYWAAVETGPEDVPRYQRVFGRPAHDPNLHRLRALGYERGGDVAEAHRHWQRYEQELAAGPGGWPDGQADRARALVWLHMGRNAAEIPGPEKVARVSDLLREEVGRPRPLTPSAAKCFERAIALAPDRLEPYEALFRHHLDEGREAAAAAAGHRLLERFPDHVPTLEALGELGLRGDDPAEAVELLRRAVRGNPLDRRLREKLVTAHLGNGRAHATAGRFEEAGREYRAAEALQPGGAEHLLRCRWAATEFKAGAEARGDELLAQARRAGTPAGTAYRLLIETQRQKLPKGYKTRFEADFNAALAEAPTRAAATELAVIAAGLTHGKVAYAGQKTHLKKVLGYLDRARAATFTEPQLLEMCSALMLLGAPRLTQRYLDLGSAEFPRNPHFPYLQAALLFTRGADRLPVWQARHLLERAERLARALPRDERTEALLKDIAERQQALAALNPFAAGLMEDVFREMFGGPFGDEGDY